ncbi:MAG: DnaJ domain-containing protein [Candidatus Lernaella stagnicola]|nr:DnaJ domain-containing protein [Candidatus Lernaella stagnicola]
MSTVLIVIHNRSELRRFATKFREAGFDVVPAADGLSGLDLFHETQPDAVIINLLIPKLSGGELCKRLKSDPEGTEVPVAILSGLFKRTDMADRARRQWQADAYFQAPHDIDEIVRHIEKLVADAPPRPKRPAPEVDEPDLAVEEDPAELLDEEFGDDAPVHSEADDATPEEPDLDALIDKAMAELEHIDLVDRSPKVAQINEEITAEKSERTTAASDNPLADLLAELEDSAGRPEHEEETAAPEAPPAEVPPVKRPRAKVSATEASDEFSYEGELADVSVPELMAHLYFARQTGILELNSQGTYKHVYFDRGRAVYVESEGRQESLGQILLRQGIISEDDLMLSLANMATYGKKQGGALVEMGMINPMQLYQALRLQMREKLLSLFQWFDGDYYFDASPFDKYSLTIFENPMPQMIHDGIAQSYDGDSLAEMFSGLLEQVVVRNEPMPFDEREFDADEDLWKVYALIDDRRTIAEVVADSPLEAGPTYVLLFAMLILRMYDRARAEEVVPADESVEIEVELPLEETTPAADDDFILFDDEPEPEPTPEPSAAPPEPADELDFAFEDDGDLETISEAERLEDIEKDLRAFEEGDGEPGTGGPKLPAAEAGELVAIDGTGGPAADADDPELATFTMEQYLKLEGANHYEVLDVDRDAKPLDLKMVYHAVVKRLHPDMVASKLGPDMREKAKAVVQAVTEAYEVLSSPKKRAEYDSRLTGEGQELKERHITTILAAERAFNQGMIALRRNHFHDAQEHFSEACELFPEEAEYHAYLGWALFNDPKVDAKERATLARESVERSLRINSKGDKAYYFLGKIMLRYGSKDKARQMFAMAYRFNKGNEDARNELRRLQAERERERAKLDAEIETVGVGDLFKKDIDLGGVKRALKKLFT